MKINILSFLLSSGLCLSLNAADGMKPGLWEHSFTMKSESGKVEKAMADVKKQMESLPADQRKMMEEMMAKQGLGVGGKGGSVKVCISKEQADNLDFPQNQMDNCTQEILERTSNSLKMKFKCTGSNESSGEANFKLTNSKAYTGTAIINSMTEGKPDRMDMNSKGKWLKDDCGNIKSIQTKK